MKKILIIILAVITTLIVVELILRFVVQYPIGYGKRRFVLLGGNSPYRDITLRDPYYEFWSVEGGNKKFSHNNIGTHGPDIDLSQPHRYVFLAGSSFIEAFQVDHDQTAAAVFDRDLKQCGNDYSVINIGSSGNDPYVAWFRAQFFSRLYKPDKVVLAIEDTFDEWLQRHGLPLDYTLPERFGQEIPTSKAFRLVEKVRHQSSLLNLLAQFLRSSQQRGGNGGEQEEPAEPKHEAHPSGLSQQLKDAILKFHESYGDDFLLVSFNNDANANKMLDDFCCENAINFQGTETILQPQYRVGGNGHLNRTGNEKLGEFLYEAFYITFGCE